MDVDLKIDFKSKITMIGSCFTESIGNHLIESQFNVMINPFNIVFNPFSISQQLFDKSTNEKHFIPQNGRVFSLDYHSKFNGESASDLVRKISNTKILVQKRLDDTDVLIITFGTAWTYHYKATGLTIGNCQKLPADQFRKELLSSSDLELIYSNLFTSILSKNPTLKIILTVSPVRHIKDGLVENNRSKAILLSLCQHLEAKYARNVIYYPSYEIVMDDLRDYRFYKKDLLHPNQMAIDYIYNHFKDTFFCEQTMNTEGLILKYNKLNNHKDLHTSSQDLKKRHEKLDSLAKEIAALKLS